MRDRAISRLVAVVAASWIVGTLLVFGGTSRAAQLQRPIICCADSPARPPGPRDRFAVAKPIPFQRLQRQLASSPIGASRSDEAFLKMADQTARFAPSLEQPVHVSLLSRSERPAGRRRCRLAYGPGSPSSAPHRIHPERAYVRGLSSLLCRSLQWIWNAFNATSATRLLRPTISSRCSSYI